jgi:signal transduction histidine kinase
MAVVAGSEQSSGKVLRKRVLILAPVGRDAALACGVLRHEDLSADICKDVSQLIAELESGAGTAVIADEALNGNFLVLQKWVEGQPTWSDFPFIILTGSKSTPGKMQERFTLMRPLGNVTLLERPLRSVTLLSVVRTALRARFRQYEVEHYIEEIRQAEAERAQAYAREEAAQAQIELLNHVGGILSAELNLDALLPAIMDAGADLSGADVGIFFLERVIEGVRKFALRCSSGLALAEANRLLGEKAQMESEQFSWKRLSHCSSFHEPPSSASEAWLQTVADKLSLGACIALPVTSRPGAVLGILLFGRRNLELFSSRDESVAGSLASQAAIAIDNARLFTVAEQERRRLESVRQVLQRSNQELRQFAYIASHDLQEPLRTIATFTQLLVSRASSAEDPQHAEFATYIVDGVQRMSSLIRGLLQYSSTGVSNSLPDEPSSAEAALSQAVFALSASIQENAAVITHDPLPDVWMDDRSLTLLLQNLIGNAIKYRCPDPPHIHISAEPVESDWRFSVSDNGIGIAPEYHERIFGIFKRLHGKEVPGTGIGLAICQRIVQWHGGKIWVKSKPGCGAAFHFSVPTERQRIQGEMDEFAAFGGLR